MSLIGTQLQPFQAEAFKNNEFITVTDKDLLGKWSVVFFYPADFTFVCPTELEDLAEQYAEFQKIGVEIYAVSTDTHFTHKAWHDTSAAIKKVEYPMVGDPTGARRPRATRGAGSRHPPAPPSCRSAATPGRSAGRRNRDTPHRCGGTAPHASTRRSSRTGTPGAPRARAGRAWPSPGEIPRHRPSRRTTGPLRRGTVQVLFASRSSSSSFRIVSI
mgnify:CR=1 FL=1